MFVDAVEQKYMQLWFTKLKNIVMKLDIFVYARFVHGTVHFCTISIVIEVRLTSSHRTPSRQAIVEPGNLRNARNVDWGGRT